MSIDAQKLKQLLLDLERLKLTQKDGQLSGVIFDLSNKILAQENQKLLKIIEEINEKLLDLKMEKTPQRGIDYFNKQEVREFIKEVVPQIQAEIRMPEDGEDGYTPIKGKDYFDGEDGYTPVKGKDYFDGEDADPTKTALQASKLAQDAVLPLIPKIDDIEADLPKLGTEIASALELLPKEEKLKIEAISGLKEILDELKKKPVSLGGGGGFSYLAMLQHIVDDETPGGTINGVNTIFTLANTPNPPASLKVYRGGARQRITEDYTLSGSTVTFTIAPVSGEILLADYLI